MTKTFSSTRSVGLPETGLPLRRRRSAHVTLVFAWVAFWLNTALVPCCEAFAAAFDGHTDVVTQSISGAKQAQLPDLMHSESPYHSPASPCADAFDAGPAINGVVVGPSADRVDQQWAAIPVIFAVCLTSPNLSGNLARSDYRPPLLPANVRLYLHTQRLLI